MAIATDKVFDEVLSLPSDVRLNLIDRLLKSLNLPTRAEIDNLWAEEAERRIAQIDRGDVDIIPGDVVFAKIRQKYQK